MNEKFESYVDWLKFSLNSSWSFAVELINQFSDVPIHFKFENDLKENQRGLNYLYFTN